jgi:hypothetical protein
VYSWTIVNKGVLPLTWVRFPHFRAGLFFVPPGWSTAESTFIVNVGVPDRPGFCVGRATEDRYAIAPGKSAAFGMQIAASGARRGRGSVAVRFADGTEYAVENVELPQPEPVLERFAPLIAVAVFLGVVVMVRMIRARRRETAVSGGVQPH